MFKYLGSQGFISPTEADSLNDLTPLFRKFARSQFKTGEYDVLHGALGIFLATRIAAQKEKMSGIKGDTDELIPLIISELSRLAIPIDDHSLSWESTNPIKGYREINFGLAHGFPSILFILSLIYKISSDKTILSGLICPGMNFLLQHKSQQAGKLSFFPIRIKNNKAQTPSRMAWCYGDPGIALAIYHIGENCGRQDWQSQATAILDKASVLLSLEDTGVCDACICHGSAGLALIYYAAGRKTGYEPFLDTARLWTRTTLDFGNNPRGSAGYLFKGNQNKYLSNYSLLEGISGVGLSLLALLDGELPGWEKGLMI